MTNSQLYQQVFAWIPLSKLPLTLFLGGVGLWALLFFTDSPKVQADNVPGSQKRNLAIVGPPTNNLLEKPSFLPPPPGPFYHAQYPSRLPNHSQEQQSTLWTNDASARTGFSSPQIPVVRSPAPSFTKPQPDFMTGNQSPLGPDPGYFFSGTHQRQSFPAPPRGYGQIYPGPWTYPHFVNGFAMGNGNYGMGYLPFSTYQTPMSQWGDSAAPYRFANGAAYPAPYSSPSYPVAPAFELGGKNVPVKQGSTWNTLDPWGVSSNVEGSNPVWNPGISGYEFREPDVVNPPKNSRYREP